MIKSPILNRTGRFLTAHGFLFALFVFVGGIIVWTLYDTLVPSTEYWDLYYPNLPPPLDGKTIAQLSDLHLEDLRIPPQRIRAILQAAQPDLLVLTGDVISTGSDLDKVSAYLDNLPSRYGKYIVMGNNDYAHFSHTLFERYLTLLRGLGWSPLLNDAVYNPDLHLWIIGVDDPATAHDDVPKAYAKLNNTNVQGTFRLVLAHSTDCLDDVAQEGADLLLTGHTHGGQIRLPGLQPFLANTYLGSKGLYEGYHVVEGIPLYINRGLGESMLPFRFNVRPEITIFTLHRGDSPPRHHTG